MFFKTLISNRYNRTQFVFRQCSSLNLWNEEITIDVKHKIENHWCKLINNQQYDYKKEKCYILSMFPYPSGHLHMGHVRVYTISDSVARFQRMNGKNVIHPIGWDSFGLPAENAAIERNVSPEKWTNRNINFMKNQLKQLGCSFDWEREISTCDPQYYQWTQDLFLKLFENGLVYQRKALVNWDPIDKTVLADEQVDENGYAWRSGAKVEKKYLKQWFVKTTKYAKDLLNGLDDPILQDWRDIIKLQKHWIGDCNGATFNFKLTANDEEADSINVWTDKPEFLGNAKFIIVPSRHLYANLNGEILDDGTKRLGVEAENFINDEKLLIFVCDSFEYEAEFYLGIPGKNEKDTEFAIKHNISFTQPNTNITKEELRRKQQEICSKAKSLDRGGYWTSAKLRDWLISRQRYWGTPIPIVHCKSCGPQPVPRKDLPVVLPRLTMDNQKSLSLLTSDNWLNTTCPKCNSPATREMDTMDTFVDSSWYYLRYLDPKNNDEMFRKEIVKELAPVDLYVGGKEHAVLHLYYARFISHFLHSVGLVPSKEPFKRLLVQGMVMGRSFKMKKSGKYVHEEDVNIIDLKRNKATLKETGEPIVVSWEKMSKSKYNGVDPSEMFQKYGVDTTRLLIMADVAPTSPRHWNSNTFPGVLNWQRRLWLTIQQFIAFRETTPKEISQEQFDKEDCFLFDSRNYYVKGATFNYCLSQQMSVAVSKMQGLTNSLRRVSPAIYAKSLQFERALACQIILLAPMAPHFASELWQGFLSAKNRLSNSDEIAWDKPVLEQKWPEIDYDYKLELVVKVNGHENDVFKFSRKELEHLPREEALKLALNNEKVQSVLKTRSILDVEYITYPGYENVLNILTTEPPPKIKVEEQQIVEQF